MPKIAILLATHNRSHFLGETLDSIFGQTYINWECIIVDDHSEDYTPQLVSFYLEKDSRFSYYKKTVNYKKGLSGTRNQGLDLIENKDFKYIQFFDDDDIMHPQMLELKLLPFLKDPSLDLTICCYRKFDKIEMVEFDLELANDQSCKINATNLLKSFFLNKINLNSPGPLWKTEILNNHRFNENLFYAEEKEYYLRIFLKENLKYKPVEAILFWYRKHSEAITSSFYKEQRVKSDSMCLYSDIILNETLKHKDPPFFILKNYVALAVHSDREDYLKKIKDYFCSSLRWLRLKPYLLLFFYIFKFYEKKKNINSRSNR